MNEPITRREALKKGALFGGAALVWVRPSVNSYGMSSTLAAAVSGTQGCTPGFYAQNPGRYQYLEWPEGTALLPGRLVNTVFGTSYQWPLEKVLNPKEWDNASDTEAKLLRHGLAALFNALNLGVGYPLTAAAVVALVNGAIGSSSMSDVKDELAGYNELGCPIPADESAEDYEAPADQSIRPSEQVGGDA